MNERILVSVLCCLVGGCGQATLEGRDAGPGTDAGPGADAGNPAKDLSCADLDLGTSSGLAVGVDTEAEADDIAPSCGGSGSPDQLLAWTAPFTDYYVFDTFRLNFDTVLALFDECAGRELACSNNVGETAQSEIVRKFSQGEQALIAVDGVAGDSGYGDLFIQRVTCPDVDLEGQTFPLEQSTVDFGDDFSSQCGGVGFEDRAYHWVAPEDGLYYFRATSRTFTPVVTLIDGPRCGDRILGCNAGYNGELGAEVVRHLRAGQIVGVVVDGLEGAGLFTLDIGLREDQVCPEQSLAGVGDMFHDDFTGRTLAPSCGYARALGAFGQLFEPGDKVYTFEVPSKGGCFGGCEVQVSAPQSFVVYALEGSDCGGAETACVAASEPDANGVFTGSVSFSMEEEARTYTVVISDVIDLDSGGFDLQPVCFIACP